jgi:signal transduction histidine kinase
VRLSLSMVARQVVLEVSDDGRGFESGDAGTGRAASSGGLGLDSMRERAAAAGGTLTIRSDANGTVVRMTVPGRTGR